MKHYNATTLISRCQSAAAYAQHYGDVEYGYWIAIGKTSPWPNDSQPPLPPISSFFVPEVFGFCWVHTCLTVYADQAGPIQTPDQNYSYLQIDDPALLANAKANKVYMESLLAPSIGTTGLIYRVKGLCTKVEFNNPPTQLAPGKFVPAADVNNYFLDWISVHEPILISPSTSQTIQIIREF